MKKTRNAIRIILAFPVGLIGYALGFCVSILLAVLLTAFQITYVGGPIESVKTTAAAMGANLIGLRAFGLVAGDYAYIPAIIFASIELALAILYGIAAILSGDWPLLWYTVVSCAICIYFIVEFVKESRDAE